jgi:hypothetical protein
VKFVSARDMRNSPSEFRETLEREDVVLTVGGKPYAIAVGVGEDAVEETLELLRRVRTLHALTHATPPDEGNGANGMSPERIEEQVRAARQTHRHTA